jgi:aldehyde dehydrogenase (NAD+)
LAAYLFSRSNSARQQLIERSQSGSVAFNDVIVQAGVPGLPFGGVGPSGIGRCHGEAGFRSLSNQKSVYQRPFALDLAWRYPPYGNRLSLLKRLLG